MRLFLVTAALGLVGSVDAALAEPRCAPMLESESLALIYLDLPDPVASRVTGSVEEALLAEQISGPMPAPLTKLYCHIGMFEMSVRFVQPVEDDSIAGIVTEAVYAWQPDGEPAGWQLSAMNRQFLCARGDEPFAPLCP